MKLNRNTDFRIIKKIDGSQKSEPLDYNKWIEFVDKNSDFFIWKEHTENGIQILKDIDKVPENFKDRILASLNKGACYSEFDAKKGYYNINVNVNKVSNWISINFERTPKLEDLKIFLKMANYLDASLLMEGKQVINENDLN